MGGRKPGGRKPGGQARKPVPGHQHPDSGKPREEDFFDEPEGIASLPEIPREFGIDPLLLAVMESVVFLSGSDESVVNPDAAESVLSRITPAASERPIEILDWMDARSISELILDEHPQIVALIISYLDYGLAADVLTLLPQDMQPEIVRRIATLETVQPEAVRELERVMQRKFKQNTTLRASQIGGVKAAAKIMNFTKTAMESRIMKSIAKENKVLMTAIQDNMFVFDNLILSDDRSLQTLLRSLPQEALVLALKGADEALREKLFGCMSTRAAANLKDEMEALGPVRLTDVQEAQKQIINIARKLSDDGTIVLAGRGGDEMV